MQKIYSQNVNCYEKLSTQKWNSYEFSLIGEFMQTLSSSPEDLSLNCANYKCCAFGIFQTWYCRSIQKDKQKLKSHKIEKTFLI